MIGDKPVIGIVGGVGSGKSFVAGLFGELGCMVIDADRQITEAYEDPHIKITLLSWWGQEVFKPDGQLDRGVIATKIFTNPAERKRLEGLLHPIIDGWRKHRMAEAAHDAQVVAFAWDAPLLFEAGLDRECDAIVFVEAPQDLRLQRVSQKRSWSPAELIRREKSQMPLDKKRELADYIVQNTADAANARRQVKEVLSRILAGESARNKGAHPPTGLDHQAG